VKKGGDFRIGFHAKLDEPVKRTTADEYYGYGNGRWYTGKARWYQDTHVPSWEPGVLVLDIVDGKNGELVWRAAADADLHKADTREKREKVVDQALEKLFDLFPPP
jgi:hypothetical protein